MVTRLHRVLGLNQALLGNSFQTRNSVSTKSSHGKGKVVDGKAKVREVCQSVLTELRNEGLLKNERVITSKQGTHIDVRGQNGKILNFCANNYLGLAVSICALSYVITLSVGTLQQFHFSLFTFFSTLIFSIISADTHCVGSK